MSSWIAIAAGGALGACLRYAVGLGVGRWIPGTALPLGNLTANAVGCLFMGIAAGWFTARSTGESDLTLFVMVGLLGGFTTFSAFGQEVWSMLEQQRYGSAVLHVLLHNVLGITLVFAGHWASRAGLKLLDASRS